MQSSARLSRRTRNLAASPIREILAVIDRPGMISFAGGLPAEEVLPSLKLPEVPVATLQYGASEGEPALRRQVCAELNTLGLNCRAEQILILSGSQQGIDLVAKLFIDDDTPVAIEIPTYLAALQVFRYFGARFVPLATLPAGVPAFAYAVPTFQNPTGRCYDAAERNALAQACDRAGTPLFEDDPYRDLVYDDCDRSPICARLQRAPWIYQGSFSKSLAPGLRLGFLAASPEFLPGLTRLKQAADLHSNRLSQHIVLEHLRDPDRPARLALLAGFYRDRRDRFQIGLNRYFGELACWQAPPGGLFFWLTLNRRIDTRELLPLAIDQGVAFMPGENFYPEPSAGLGTLRLNFSHANPAQMEEGLGKLATLFEQACDVRSAAQ